MVKDLRVRMWEADSATKLNFEFIFVPERDTI